MRRLFVIFLVVVGGLVPLVFVSEVFACGHDGLFIGGGYAQSHLFTYERRFLPISNVNERVSFGPAFGGHAVIGYDFCKTRWGIQFPAEFVTLRLNNERTQLLTVNAEAIYHLASWDNGMDVHLVGGGGVNYLREGETFDRSASVGANMTLGPGVSWFFSRGALSGAITLQIPFRSILFFGDNLTENQTLTFMIPIRFGMTFGF